MKFALAVPVLAPSTWLTLTVFAPSVPNSAPVKLALHVPPVADTVLVTEPIVTSIEPLLVSVVPVMAMPASNSVPALDF